MTRPCCGQPPRSAFGLRLAFAAVVIQRMDERVACPLHSTHAPHAHALRAGKREIDSSGVLKPGVLLDSRS